MQEKKFTLAYLAELLGAELKGDSEYEISGLADIEQAQASQISFVAGKAYVKFLQTSRAGALLLRPDLAHQYTGNSLLLDNPYWGFAKLSALFDERPVGQAGVHPTAFVSETADIHPTASIGPQCVVEAGAVVGANSELVAGVYVGAGANIGDNCLLYPKVTLYHGVAIGSRVTIHSATVIGSDGFGFAPTASGWQKIHQLGAVVVGDDVEIGAGCTIDRGALGNTEIARGVIIDNQVHLAHNVKIGEYTAIAGCCGIAGSTEVGAHCLLGGSVNISGHLKIADHVQFNGAAVVTKSIREPGIYASGTPLQPVKTWRKNAVRYGQLESLFQRVKNNESGAVDRGPDDDSEQ